MNQDAHSLRMYSKAVLEWGGVTRGNVDRINAFGDGIVSYFKDCQQRISPLSFDTEDAYDDIIMNAGFTKIYSLLMDDFIIYDSRVGAALGLLVRQYCQEQQLRAVPPSLRFAYGNSRPTKSDVKGAPNRRDPGNVIYKFPLLRKDSFHTRQNLMGSWLLKELLYIYPSKFSNMPKEIQLRAREASLFMVGYDVNTLQGAK